MGYGPGVDLLEVQLDALPRLVQGSHADSAKHLPGHLAEEALYDVGPRTVGRREHHLEPARVSLEPGPGLPRPVYGVVVEHEPYDVPLGVLGVEGLQQLDELAAPVALPHHALDRPVLQVYAGEQRGRAAPAVLVVARHGPSPHAGSRPQVLAGRGERLDAGLLVHRDDVDLGPLLLPRQQVAVLAEAERELLVDDEHLVHLPPEVGVAPLAVAGGAVRARLGGVEHAMDRGLRRPGEGRVARLAGPDLRGVAEVGGPGAGDVDDPGPVPVADAAGPAPPGRVGERRPQAAVTVLADARLGGVGVDAEPRGHGYCGLARGKR